MLSERAARILDFEESAPRSPGRKEEAIRAEFGISAVRYYQLLNQLVDDPAARAAHPLLVSRLERMRERRQAFRATR